MSSAFVFEADVLGCKGRASECENLKRDFIEQSCWGQLIALQKCEMTSVTKVCFQTRTEHLGCLAVVKADIEAKLSKLNEKKQV